MLYFEPLDLFFAVKQLSSRTVRIGRERITFILFFSSFFIEAVHCARF